MMPAINFITFISQLKLSGLCDVSVSSKNPLLDLKARKKGHGYSTVTSEKSAILAKHILIASKAKFNIF